MTANVNRRHARTKGQPRRTWAPLGEVTHNLPVLEERLPVLTARQADGLCNQFAIDLWVDTRDKHGVSDALVILAPHRTPAKKVARSVRWLVELGLWAAALGAVFAVGPVLHAMGV